MHATTVILAADPTSVVAPETPAFLVAIAAVLAAALVLISIAVVIAIGRLGLAGATGVTLAGGRRGRAATEPSPPEVTPDAAPRSADGPSVELDAWHEAARRLPPVALADTPAV